VELRVTIDDDPELRQPREPLEQIVRELVVNAVDACRRASPVGQIVLRLGTRADEAVVEVHDHGPGMDPEVAAHAFDPFFSTKDQGMGLGLYLARAQLRQLGGHLELDSKPGRGTSLRLVLPLQPSSIQGAAAPRRP
ncbi:MAG: ATP-binding protein, partial [Myxococcales bacterium]|nr:ATP-binding protein [Myxococcales bacterium]